jgi:hypothetical protein
MEREERATRHGRNFSWSHRDAEAATAMNEGEHAGASWSTATSAGARHRRGRTAAGRKKLGKEDPRQGDVGDAVEQGPRVGKKLLGELEGEGRDMAGRRAHSREAPWREGGEAERAPWRGAEGRPALGTMEQSRGRRNSRRHGNELGQSAGAGRGLGMSRESSRLSYGRAWVNCHGLKSREGTSERQAEREVEGGSVEVER